MSEMTAYQIECGRQPGIEDMGIRGNCIISQKVSLMFWILL